MNGYDIEKVAKEAQREIVRYLRRIHYTLIFIAGILIGMTFGLATVLK